MTPGNKDVLSSPEFIPQAPTAGFQTLWVQRQLMNFKQLNNLLQRITGFRLEYYGKYTKTKTWAELGSPSLNYGNMLIAKAYLDADCGNIKPGCGNMLIAKAYGLK